MKADLNKPLFAKLVFTTSSESCEDCVFSRAEECPSCCGGHWELNEVLPQSGTASGMQQLHDFINSIDSKMQQIKEEAKEEPKYFY